MATQDEVYRAFGITAEVAQFMECDLGVVIAADQAIRSGARSLADLPVVMDALDRFDRHTMGQKLRELKKRYRLVGDIEPVLDRALEVRNDLMHNFFYRHVDAMESETGRDAMMLELAEYKQVLDLGYEMARTVSAELLAHVVSPGKSRARHN
jgi:hypothetical protein